VLLVTHDLSLTGAPMMVYVLAKCLRDEGYAVLVSSPREGGIRTLYAESGIEVAIVPGLLDDDRHLAASAGRFDVVVANTINSWRLIHACRAAGLPSVLWVHESEYGQDVARRNRRVAEALAVADAVVFPAAATTARYAAFRTRDNFRTIHYGLDRKMMEGGGEVVPRTEGRLNVINIGSIESRKGQDVLLRAIAALPEDVAGACQFYFIGRTNDRGLQAELLRAGRSATNIHVIGEASHDVAMSYLRAMDVLVLASRDEVLPVIVLEAMCLGKGVIATRVGGVPEMIDDGVSGLLVDVELHAPMADAIGRLHRDRALLARVGEGARVRFEERFSVERFKAAMSGVVRSVMAARASRSDPLPGRSGI